MNHVGCFGLLAEMMVDLRQKWIRIVIELKLIVKSDRPSWLIFLVFGCAI